MEPYIGQQVLINSRPGVIVAMGEPGPVQAVMCFWPGTLAPQMVLGLSVLVTGTGSISCSCTHQAAAGSSTSASGAL